MNSPSPSKITDSSFKGEKSQGSAKSKKTTGERSSTVTFSFPPPTADPTPSLAPLKDDTSAYAIVAKSCLQLTQYAGYGSSSHMEETTTVASSALFHEPSYAKIISTSFAALMECIQSHKDRRCRILACKTLAILARSAYARIRHSPLIFSMREPILTRLEDEAANDVPSSLVTAALEDADDGVSACAVEALGIMTLSSSPTVGTLVEDELLREIQSIAFARVSPYAPTLRAVVDEDPSIPQAELQTRIFENVLSPRLLQLVDRILQYPQTAYIALALPCLTAVMCHQVKTTPSMRFGMDRSTYSKRWLELDAQGLVDTVVHSLILPSLQVQVDGPLAQTAALSGLRLAQASFKASWVTTVARWAVIVLKEEEEDTTLGSLEDRLATLSTTVVALRAVPFPERTACLLTLAQKVHKLPPTTCAPVGIASAGLLLEWQSLKSYRRPARMGLWTEIALSFFVDGPGTRRADCLKTFLSSSLISEIMAEPENQSTLSPRDEILLAFTTVAIDTGRRFRVGADGNATITDPHAPAVDEWCKLVWVVLTSFVSCVMFGPKPAYLEEDLSLITAGLANYVQLVQEYLHTVGLLQPTSSVASKLTTNACPPHILWDRMVESSALLAKFESVNLGALEQTTKLMEEIVAREKKHGIPSHHMRLFLLAMAADHWVQGRITIIRNNLDTSTKFLNVHGGREIILALSPKRLLAKLFEAHVPPAGHSKRDPIKKLALETVRMCVACIENIALMSIDWRRRFGSGNEPKQLVSAAVGVLQGKVDDSPAADDNVRTIMGPLCQAAVSRIQAYYESDSGGVDQNFPFSELVAQPVKTKIKPLISATKPPICPKDIFMRGYLMQLSRQIASSRVQQAIASSPPADSLQTPSRPMNWLRLEVPPFPESRDGRILGNYGEPLAAWGKSVRSVSSASDAAQLVLACTPQRCLRYDGEDEYRIGVLLRVFNMTAVDFVEGLRLELGLCRSEINLDDEFMNKLAQSLGGTVTSILSDGPLVSSAVVYRNEVKSGEYLTWQVTLNNFTNSSAVDLMPSVVYRNIPVEPDDVGAKWVGDTGGCGDASTVGGESKSGENDFQVTGNGLNASKGDEAKTENVVVTGEPLSLSPLIGFGPCPLIFFRDRWGDSEIFRFLWFRMPHQLAPVKIGAPSLGQSAPTPDHTSRKIASMSMIRWAGEAIPGGFASKAWAFSTFSGRRVLCIFAESDTEGGPGKQGLYFRSDCKSSLSSLVCTEAARSAVVAALLPGMTIV